MQAERNAQLERQLHHVEKEVGRSAGLQKELAVALSLVKQDRINAETKHSAEIEAVGSSLNAFLSAQTEHAKAD